MLKGGGAGGMVNDDSGARLTARLTEAVKTWERGHGAKVGFMLKGGGAGGIVNDDSGASLTARLTGAATTWEREDGAGVGSLI